MLQIFDKEGNETLSLTDNVTRVVAIYRKSEHNGKLPPPNSDVQKLLESGKLKPFIVGNMLLDLYDDDRYATDVAYLKKWYETATMNDVLVMGVYHNV